MKMVFSHVLSGNSTGKKTADIELSVKKNGVNIPSGDFKIKIRNAKYTNGFKNGKTPAIVVKLNKNYSKEARNIIKKKELGFDIVKPDLATDLDFEKFDFKLNKKEDKIKKISGIRIPGLSGECRYKPSKNGTSGDIVATVKTTRPGNTLIQKR